MTNREHIEQANTLALVALAVLLLLATMLTGCATDPAIIKSAQEAANKPTFQVTCPESGCVIASISYTDPRDRQVRLPTNGWDSLNHAVSIVGNVATGAIVPAAFAITAKSGFDALKGSGATTTTTTTTMSGTGVLGSGTYGIDQTHAPTVVTQPAPVVVQPVVVQVPAQVVTPVVVDPVVVRP